MDQPPPELLGLHDDTVAMGRFLQDNPAARDEFLTPAESEYALRVELQALVAAANPAMADDRLQGPCTRETLRAIGDRYQHKLDRSLADEGLLDWVRLRAALRPVYTQKAGLVEDTVRRQIVAKTVFTIGVEEIEDDDDEAEEEEVPTAARLGVRALVDPAHPRNNPRYATTEVAFQRIMAGQFGGAATAEAFFRPVVPAWDPQIGVLPMAHRDAQDIYKAAVRLVVADVVATADTAVGVLARAAGAAQVPPTLDVRVLLDPNTITNQNTLVQNTPLNGPVPWLRAALLHARQAAGIEWTHLWQPKLRTPHMWLTTDVGTALQPGARLSNSLLRDPALFCPAARAWAKRGSWVMLYYYLLTYCRTPANERGADLAHAVQVAINICRGDSMRLDLRQPDAAELHACIAGGPGVYDPRRPSHYRSFDPFDERTLTRDPAQTRSVREVVRDAYDWFFDSPYLAGFDTRQLEEFQRGSTPFIVRRAGHARRVWDPLVDNVRSYLVRPSLALAGMFVISNALLAGQAAVASLFPDTALGLAAAFEVAALFVAYKGNRVILNTFTEVVGATKAAAAMAAAATPASRDHTPLFIVPSTEEVGLLLAMERALSAQLPGLLAIWQNEHYGPGLYKGYDGMLGLVAYLKNATNHIGLNETITRVDATGATGVLLGMTGFAADPRGTLVAFVANYKLLLADAADELTAEYQFYLREANNNNTDDSFVQRTMRTQEQLANLTRDVAPLLDDVPGDAVDWTRVEAADQKLQTLLYAKAPHTENYFRHFTHLRGYAGLSAAQITPNVRGPFAVAECAGITTTVPVRATEQEIARCRAIGYTGQEFRGRSSLPVDTRLFVVEEGKTNVTRAQVDAARAALRPPTSLVGRLLVAPQNLFVSLTLPVARAALDHQLSWAESWGALRSGGLWGFLFATTFRTLGACPASLQAATGLLAVGLIVPSMVGRYLPNLIDLPLGLERYIRMCGAQPGVSGEDLLLLLDWILAESAMILYGNTVGISTMTAVLTTGVALTYILLQRKLAEWHAWAEFEQGQYSFHDIVALRGDAWLYYFYRWTTHGARLLLYGTVMWRTQFVHLPFVGPLDNLRAAMVEALTATGLGWMLTTFNSLSSFLVDRLFGFGSPLQWMALDDRIGVVQFSSGLFWLTSAAVVSGLAAGSKYGRGLAGTLFFAFVQSSGLFALAGGVINRAIHFVRTRVGGDAAVAYLRTLKDLQNPPPDNWPLPTFEALAGQETTTMASGLEESPEDEAAVFATTLPQILARSDAVTLGAVVQSRMDTISLLQ